MDAVALINALAYNTPCSTGAYPSGASYWTPLSALIGNIRLSWNCLSVTNALAYKEPTRVVLLVDSTVRVFEPTRVEFLLESVVRVGS